MSTDRQRATLVSSGEHIYAVRRLGDSYSTEEYLRAVQDARDVGAGERYAEACLGPDVDAVLTGVEQDRGEEVVRAAERRLRSRGVDPEKASYRQYVDALVEVAS